MSDFFKSVPVMLLALGIGIGLGVSLTVGLEFSKADGARFLGGLIGALIAVSGAVTLHFLKESGETRERRKHLRMLMRNCKEFGESVIKDFENNGSDLDCSLEAFTDQMKYTKEYAESRRFEDFAISKAYSFFDNINFEHFDLNENDFERDEVREYVVKAVTTYVRLVERAELHFNDN